LAGLGLLGAAPCMDERRRQIADAQAKGGCLPASTCDAGSFRLQFPYVCYPAPGEQDRVVNDVKAAEIEGAVLENVAEEAEKPESNTPEAQQKAIDAAHQLDADHEAFRRGHEAYVSAVATAGARQETLLRRLAV